MGLRNWRGRINRFSPAGELIEYIALPVTHPTMPCFVVADRRTLYVTSLREGLIDADAGNSLAGVLFRIEVA